MTSCAQHSITARPSQTAFDWEIGHARPWLKVTEIARLLSVSENHVYNLFDDGALDAVVDIKAPDATKPAYRVLRESFRRYTDKDRAPTPFDAVLGGYLVNMPAALASHHIANHLRCSETLVLLFADDFFNAASPSASQICFRATKAQLLSFLRKRRIT